MDMSVSLNRLGIGSWQQTSSSCGSDTILIGFLVGKDGSERLAVSRLDTRR